jgi:hypothetical protein
MEIVTVNPTISPFQQALLDGVRRGVLGDGDVERIRREGAVLVQKTAERFFTDSAREESYLYAVRMVDVLLSFALARHLDPTGQIAGSPLNDILKNALSVLRESNGWPSAAYLPSVPGSEMIAEYVVPNIRKSSLTSNERLALLKHEYSQRHENEATVRLATYFVSLQNSKQEFVMDPCDDIIASHLFSVVYGLEQGYRFTLSDLRAISRRKRPSIERVASVLDQYRATIPEEYLVAYDSAIRRFFEKTDVLRFFGSKGCSMNVFLGEYGGIYYVGSHARSEVPILDQDPD